MKYLSLFWLLPAILLTACDSETGGGSGGTAGSTNSTSSTSSTSSGGSGAGGNTTTGSGGVGGGTGGSTSTSSGSTGASTTTGTGTTTKPNHTNCDDLIADFAAETKAIRSCTSNDQCGQVLQGTSCGCTRDWVARLDADTTYFYQLITEAGELQCDIGLFSTCDCPGANGFECTPEGICNWNYQ
ncbi:MAG: hypothetical protein IPK82_30355 [Polyangiaceae bacterium]|nr:hypothetical protein [Polyangiaceae bacterium]